MTAAKVSAVCVHINGHPHGPATGATTCQIYMRRFKDGDTITVEPWRSAGFPVIKDLMVDPYIVGFQKFECKLSVSISSFFIVITQLNIPLALLYLTIQSYMIADMQI